LKEKIGIFMERKECNAEGKASACQIPCFISAMFYKIFTHDSASGPTKKNGPKNVFLGFY
jgi:hypothetical protein